MVKRKRLESYEVESILKRKDVDGEPHYRVHWKGYSSEDDTWEPLSHLQTILPMVQAFDARLDKQDKPHVALRKGPRVADIPPASPPVPLPQGNLDIDEVSRLVNIWKQGDRVFVCEVEYKNRRSGQAVRNSQERLDTLRYRVPQMVIDLMMSLITVETTSSR